MTEYIILESNDSDDLTAQVELRLKDGWKLQGGVSVVGFAQNIAQESDEREFYIYAQAMTRIQ